MSPWGYVRGKRKNLCVVGDFEDVVKKEGGGREGKEKGTARKGCGKGMVICLEECLQEYGNFARRETQ